MEFKITFSYVLTFFKPDLEFKTEVSVLSMNTLSKDICVAFSLVTTQICKDYDFHPNE